METKFTKGPWVWSGYVLNGQGTEPVIDFEPYEGQYIDPSCDDAHLISAAPDMYEALNGLHNTIVNAFPNLSESGPMIAAKQALAKARGEQ